jgi:MipA family protein
MRAKPLLSAFIVATIASPIWAQETAEDKPDRFVMLGMGLRSEPQFPGASQSGIGPFPVINVWRESEPFPIETPDEAKGIKLFGLRKAADAGIAIAFAPRRSAKDAPAGFDSIGFGLETGIYAQTHLLPELRLRGEVRQGIGAHQALTGDLALDYVLRGRNDRQVFMIGPRARFASGKYNRTFFGVDPAASLASGLPHYRPKGGLYALGVVAGAYQPLGERWGLFGFAGYDRLQSGAARSPLVRQLGDRDQATAGIALTYTFRVKR